MKKAVALVATLVTIGYAASAQAGVLNDGYIMCLSKQALDESYSILQAGKYGMLKEIGCFPTSSAVDGVVVDRGFLTSTVRIVIPGSGTALVHVPSEAVRR